MFPQGFYIDQFTDVITIEAFSYNAALRVFARERVQLAFLPAGSILAETQIDTLQFELYDTFEGKARQTIELIFLIIVRTPRCQAQNLKAAAFICGKSSSVDAQMDGCTLTHFLTS